MLEAQAFEEVLIDDIGAGGDDGVDHSVAEQVDEDFFQPGGDERAGQAEDDAAVFVFEHAVVDVGRPGEVARGEGHVLHGFDEGDDVVPGDVDVLDVFLKIVFRVGNNSFLPKIFVVKFFNLQGGRRKTLPYNKKPKTPPPPATK